MTNAIQPVIVEKDAEMTMSGTVRIGASWDTSTRGHGGFLGKLSRKIGTDIDLIGIGCDSTGEPVRMAWLESLDPFGGSMLHSGDNQTGHGDGDDETITVHLGQVPGNIHELVFVAAAYKKNSSFADAENIAFTVYSDDPADPPMAYWPSLRQAGKNNACVIMRATRVPGSISWVMKVVNEMVKVKQGDRNSLLNTVTPGR